ncbi:DNA repair protein Rev1 [Penicillium longicatenatum]|uniref:DNA repair protein Rev1 n=1 Tax=Penicillium longicatenatum TaxID=1561947 RepID=UPI002547D19C|nr:DNA repair protein Rev1 [Penicillium longicatenatum]KAJ5643270.1 DNA repair protein Rev1 [Penicillium longicatenatum]
MGSRLNTNSEAMRKSIENHDFQDETGEEYEASSFGGFGDYMRRKKMKLQNLDAEIRASSGDCPPIFRGIVAHVNGYTQPSLQDLHRLIVSHGGGFLQYLDNKTAATHIIASSLTPKKCEEFRRYRIVKPAWVTESIKAGRLLPWNDFRVVDEGQSQKVLKFGGGRMSSQASTPRSGYKEQSSTSWYNSQLQATGTTAAGGGQSERDPITPSKATPSTPTLPLGSPGSNKRGVPSSLVVNSEGHPGPSADPESSQSQPTKTPSRKRTTPSDYTDELESPRKDDSSRIQVDPILSNSALKPLNLSGSQFIMPPQPEPKASPAPVGDIRSKFAAHAKPRDDHRPGSPCPPPRKTEEHPQDAGKPADTRQPNQTELDPETLAALPEDIRNEVLAHYGQQTSVSTPAPSVTPTPSTRPTPSKSVGVKRSGSPLSKPSRSSKPGTGPARTLMQMGFVSQSAPASDPIPDSTPKMPSPTAVSQRRPSVSTPERPQKSEDRKESEQQKEPTQQDKSEKLTETKSQSDLSDRPVFTSQGLSNLDDLRDAISAWHSTFTAEGPYNDDVEALCTYLRRVISEENDVDKAVSVVRWLMWLVDKDSRDEGPPESRPEDVVTWSESIKTMQESIQSALEARRLPAVKFE